MIVHLSERGYDPWCETETDGTFSEETISSEDYNKVTCTDCLKHIDFHNPRPVINWFGE